VESHTSTTEAPTPVGCHHKDEVVFPIGPIHLSTTKTHWQFEVTQIQICCISDSNLFFFLQSEQAASTWNLIFQSAFQSDTNLIVACQKGLVLKSS
jgi:hypothetical protein